MLTTSTVAPTVTAAAAMVARVFRCFLITSMTRSRSPSVACDNREDGEDVEDKPAAGRGGVQVLVQRGEADAALAQFGDHVDEVLEGAAVAVERGDHEGVAGVEESVTRLQLGSERVLSGPCSKSFGG